MLSRLWNTLGETLDLWRGQVKPRPADSLEAELAQVGLNAKRWVSLVRTQRRLYVDIDEAAVLRLREQDKARCDRTVEAARKVLAHEFQMLGSAPYVPVDPTRPVKPSGYRPINWYLDPVSGLRFPAGIHHKQWDLYKMRPGLADIKLLWEIGRLQHWVTLGQAFRLTQDDAFALEIANQLLDFTEANPVGIGPNWTCTMDVALRALNWALGLSLVHASRALDDQFWQTAYRELYAHGCFIHQNLENKYGVTSNHFLSNVVGLHYLAAVFHDLPSGQAWNAFARTSLETEIVAQVLPDGSDYESSVPYHRLVTELFLGSYRMALYRHEPLSEHYRGRLVQMVEFLLGVLRPDGLMPQIGDADDGRLHIFTDYGSWLPQDARHLLGPAGILFDRPEWYKVSGSAGAWESSWWGFPPTTAEGAAPPDAAKHFPDAGLAVARFGGQYLLVSNGIVGTKGFGNHKHNDQLSFEYHYRGAAVVVDPGSHVYTGDPAARNLFRSTAYHNTIVVDRTEQNEFNPEWLFRMFAGEPPETLGWTVTDRFAQFHGRHSGYRRLESAVVHERILRLDRNSGALLILDRLVGEGERTLEWNFHLAAGIKVSGVGAGFRLLTGESSLEFAQVSSALLDASIVDGWYSPSYGVRTPAPILRYQATVHLIGEQRWAFMIGQQADLQKAEEMLQDMQQLWGT